MFGEHNECYVFWLCVWLACLVGLTGVVFFVFCGVNRDTEAESAQYMTNELRAIVNNIRFWDDLDAMYTYLRPIHWQLVKLEGNKTNLANAFVCFDELQDYFVDDNPIWNIFNNKWALCESTGHPATTLIDPRFNKNYVKLENDPSIVELKEESQVNFNAQNYGIGSINNRDRQRNIERFLITIIITIIWITDINLTITMTMN